MERQIIEYANLSRGLLCAPDDARKCRIQSTQCEQKLWTTVLMQIPDDMLWHLSQGNKVLVHDRSEKDRETRAMWQGLQLVKYFCELNWFRREPEITGRGNNSMKLYFREVYASTPRSVHKRFRYYLNHLVTDKIELTSCWNVHGKARNA